MPTGAGGTGSSAAVILHLPTLLLWDWGPTVIGVARGQMGKVTGVRPLGCRVQKPAGCWLSPPCDPGLGTQPQTCSLTGGVELGPRPQTDTAQTAQAHRSSAHPAGPRGGWDPGTGGCSDQSTWHTQRCL